MGALNYYTNEMCIYYKGILSTTCCSMAQFVQVAHLFGLWILEQVRRLVPSQVAEGGGSKCASVTSNWGVGSEFSSNCNLYLLLKCTHHGVQLPCFAVYVNLFVYSSVLKWSRRNFCK